MRSWEPDQAPYLRPELTGTLMTPEEFDAVRDCEDGYFYELVHGVLVVNPTAASDGNRPKRATGNWLELYRECIPA